MALTLIIDRLREVSIFESMHLIEYLNASQNLPDYDLDLLEKHLVTETIPKGKHFLKTGERCSKVGFIEQGIMRSYFFDAHGNEFTHCFVTKYGFVTDPMAFYNQSIASQYIVSETHAQLTCFSFSSYRLFEKEIPSWESIIKKATETAYAAKVMEKSHILSEDATTRYLNFAKNHPEVLQSVPLKSIASFLGITRHSLSRIRKNISVNR